MDNYTGNKRIPGVYQKIINEIPKHTYYYEPFAGSAAIAQLLPEATVKHLNDLDKTVPGVAATVSADTVIWTHKPAIDILQSLIFSRAGTDTFIFADPPYLHSTRAQSNYYSFEMHEQDHIQFLLAAKKLLCNIMIIHPACELYDNLLAGWRSVQLKIRYNRKTSIEKLYMNYEPGNLQTYRYVGKDCWQRQAYKRKAMRHRRKSMLLPIPEVQHLIDPLQ